MDSHTSEHADKPASEPSRQLCSPIVELRQYTLHPGQRDVLIDLFERVLLDPQEAMGATLIGQFRDVEDPNRFVWLRGFPDMDKRLAMLRAFYGGSLWQEHRAEANATLVDSDNVLLLRPAHPTSGFALDPMDRPPPGDHDPPLLLPCFLEPHGLLLITPGNVRWFLVQRTLQKNDGSCVGGALTCSHNRYGILVLD